MKIILLIVFLAIGAVHMRRPIGGRSISIEQAPFFVSIMIRGQHRCSGALISTRHVLTAAHCLLDESYKRIPELEVVSGTDKTYEAGTHHRIDGIAAIPGFNWHDLQNNIGVIVLSAQVQWRINTNFIALPKEELKYHENATLMAWNTMGGPEDRSFLHQLEFEICPVDSCPGLQPIGQIKFSNEFCGIASDGQSMYNGDSGGPLIYKRRVVGIASTRYAFNNRYNSFVDVYKVLDFINAAKNRIHW